MLVDKKFGENKLELRELEGRKFELGLMNAQHAKDSSH